MHRESETDAEREAERSRPAVTEGKEQNMEEWKPFPGFERDYQISSLGRVFSRRRGNPKMLKPIHEPWNGYNLVSLFDEEGKSHKVRIGRAVAIAFIPNPEGLPCVNHKDENKTNDTVDNLEWCTKAYNTAYGTSRKRARETWLRNHRTDATGRVGQWHTAPLPPSEKGTG